MASSSGFSFGTSTGSSSLFGAKSSTSTGFNLGTTTPAFFGFGAAKSSALTGFNLGTTTPAFSGFGAAKSTAATGLSFGAPSLATATTTSSLTGFSFGNVGSTASTTTGLFGKPATTSLGLFGAKPTAGVSSFQLNTSSSAFPLATTTTASPSISQTKPLENPKEAQIPNELSTLVASIETYIKEQKDVKDEISKISSQAINKTKEQLKTMTQATALISTSLQKDSSAVGNLKQQVGQQLKNVEIAHRLKDTPATSHLEFAAPLQYFQMLVCSFEERINKSRKEIEELEMFMNSSSPLHQFTPQDLLDVLKRLNDAFMNMAAELQTVHESVKMMTSKYLQYRRTVYNDVSDPFSSRKKPVTKTPDKANLMGPSPFPSVLGAGVMSNAFKCEPKAQVLGGLNLQSGLSFSKPAGSSLTRSLSFGGTGKTAGFGGSSLGFGAPSSGFGTSFGGNSLFGKPTLGTATTTSSGFTLQKPPSGKRGKLF